MFKAERAEITTIRLEMARITRKEQLEERRLQPWLQWNQSLTHSEIASLLHDKSYHWKRNQFNGENKGGERKRKAELQEYEAKEVLEEARVTLDALKR
ncbi:MAG: hypothetical protein ACJ71B_02265 [Nitrososphaera sp.]